ncbi:CoF synthetase [Propioniciclava coleopterorum]|uniref:CoF synthetase n=1 Tax=Propioniciclava coleopterorum TaxID=2714937 RepID=A0A6G7Y516_9ACTN|nr:F390 synthetase-related protein [Propioniciclava coleopterorum]QIK71910.1 CoF synthetase [Propioniciclava coleopterorum]
MGRAAIVAAFVAARRPRRDRAALERHQARLLRRQIRFLRARSPRFADVPPDAGLADLPTMDKASMMAGFDDLVTVGVTRAEAEALALGNERSRDFTGDLRGCSIGLSSGTTGHRGLFVVSPAERDAWAGTVLARTLPRRWLVGHRIALFLRADNTLYESVGSRAVTFSYFDLYAPPAQNRARLAAFAPTILVAPPSVLLPLAAAAASGDLRIAPAKVYAVAEVLTDADAARIASGLGVAVVHQLYQCTEGFLGHTCERGVLHLNEDLALIEREYLDERRFVPIVTDLRRRAQPIVRYRLGDVLVERAEPCPCGSVLTALERIEGREDDTLLLPGLDGTPTRVFADLVTRALIHADGFTEYRVRQVGPDALEVELDADAPAVRRGVQAELDRLWSRLRVRPPAVAFMPYRAAVGRKLRRVERAWTGDTDAAL